MISAKLFVNKAFLETTSKNLQELIDGKHLFITQKQYFWSR